MSRDKPVTITLAPGQARTLLWTIQDLLDVTEDKSVRRYARDMYAKLTKAGVHFRYGLPTPPAPETKGGGHG